MDVRFVLCFLLFSVGFVDSRNVGEAAELSLDELEKQINEAIASSKGDYKDEEDEDKGDITDNLNEVNGDKFVDLDIIKNAEQSQAGKTNVQGDVIKNSANYWPKVKDANTGTVTVTIAYVLEEAGEEAVTDRVKTIFQQAIDDFQTKTCIRFKKRTNEADYILVVNDNGCYSYVGRQGGSQRLSLMDRGPGTAGCYFKGTAIHELMHAIGYFHEQSREDRDQYVTVNYANIVDRMAFNFDTTPTDYHGTAYDKSSIMHYGPRAFSKNGKLTIVNKATGDGTGLGQRDGFSKLDIVGINRFYCDKETETTESKVTTAAPTTRSTRPPITVNPCENWPKGPNFCKSVRVFRFCRFCILNNHCSSTCKDSNNNCANWAQGGFCKGRYARFMARNCSGSCKSTYCEK